MNTTFIEGNLVMPTKITNPMVSSSNSVCEDLIHRYIWGVKVFPILKCK